MLKNRKLLLLFAVSIIFLLSTVIVLIINSDSLAYPLVLFFSDNQDASLLGSAIDVWRLIIVGGAIVLINYFLAQIFFHRHRTLSILLLASNIFITFLILISIINIVSLN